MLLAAVSGSDGMGVAGIFVLATLVGVIAIVCYTVHVVIPRRHAWPPATAAACAVIAVWAVANLIAWLAM